MPVVILLLIAVVLVAGGLGSLLIGTDSVLPDRPLIAGLGGAIAIVGGCLMFGLALILRELSTLRGSIVGLTSLTVRDPAAPRSLPAGFEPDGVTAQNPVSGHDKAPTLDRTAMAGAGALAAVAAAVGTTAVAAKTEDRTQPEERHGLDAGRAPANDADSTDALFEEIDRVSKQNAATHGEQETASAVIAAPVVAQPRDVQTDSVEAELARESDPFNLQAEFDRLLDDAITEKPDRGLTPDVEIAASAPEEITSVATPENSIGESLDNAPAAISPADRNQLDELVRAAMDEVEASQESAAEIDPAIAVPPPEALRDRIAPMLSIEPVAHADDLRVPDSVNEHPVEVVDDEADIDDESDEEDVEQASDHNAAVLPVPPSEAGLPSHSSEAGPAAEISVTQSPAVEIEASADEAPLAPRTPDVTAPANPEPHMPDVPNRSIVRTFSSGANNYTMYTDGSISADTPSGRYEFASFNELRAFIDSYKG